MWIRAVFLACLLTQLAALELGKPAPELSRVAWSTTADLTERSWTLIVWWLPQGPADGGPVDMLRLLALQYGDQVAIRVLNVGAADTPAAGIATRGFAAGTALQAEAQHWIDPRGPLPLAVLLGTDRTVWWHGELVDAPRLVELAVADQLTATDLEQLYSFENNLRVAVQRGSPLAVAEALAALRTFDPGHETAIYVAMSLARQREDHAAFEQVINSIDATSTSPRFLTELASDMITEPELDWRFPQAALRLVTTAHTNHPDLLAPIIALSEIYYALGDLKQARLWNDKALAQAPDHPRLIAFGAYLSEAERLQAEHP